MIQATNLNHILCLCQLILCCFDPQKVYGLGARKIVLISVNPLGCSPMVRANNKGQCLHILNQAAQMFNLNLKTLVDDLKPQMPLSNLVFLNSYKIIDDIISHHISKGTRHIYLFYSTSVIFALLAYVDLFLSRIHSIFYNKMWSKEIIKMHLYL